MSLLTSITGRVINSNALANILCMNANWDLFHMSLLAGRGVNCNIVNLVPTVIIRNMIVKIYEFSLDWESRVSRCLLHGDFYTHSQVSQPLNQQVFTCRLLCHLSSSKDAEKFPASLGRYWCGCAFLVADEFIHTSILLLI